MVLKWTPREVYMIDSKIICRKIWSIEFYSCPPSVSVSSSANDGDYLPHAAPHTTMPDAGQTSKKVISRISTPSPLIAD